MNPSAASPVNPLLEITDWTLRYPFESGRAALERVSLSADRGEKIGIVGESGSGKSSLGLSIARLTDFAGARTGGSIRVAGKEISGLSQKELCRLRRSEVSYIFQEPALSLNPVLCVARQLQDAAPDTVLEERRRALQQVCFEDSDRILRAFPHQLSGGMKQRVLIAAALLKNASILVADESTAALDTITQKEILDLLLRLHAERQWLVLWITHDLSVAKYAADRIFVLKEGRLVEELHQADGFATKSSYAAELFKASRYEAIGWRGAGRT